MKQLSKKELKTALILVTLVVVVLVVLGAFWHRPRQNSLPSDRCTDRDWEINNCVPAGKCGPTPEIDAHIDCDVKNYDRKFTISL